MQNVKLLYLRDGREFAMSKGTLTDLSLRDKGHGPKEGTAYSTQHDAIFVWPPLEEFDSLDEFLNSETPPDVGVDYDQAALYPEWEHWCIPRDPADGFGPSQKHEEVLTFYATSYQHNAVAKAAQNPLAQQDPYRHPMNWAAAIVLTLCGLAIMVEGIVFVTL